MNDSLDLLDLAARAAERAAEYIRTVGEDGEDGEDGEAGRTASRRPHRPSVRPSDWRSKGHHDWATEVDRQAESLIGGILRAGRPGSRDVGGGRRRGGQEG